MKKIISLAFTTLLAISAAVTVSAYTYGTPNYSYDNTNCVIPMMYPYYNTGCTTPSSYYYTSGCYTYYYNGYTRTSSIVSYNCQTTNHTYVAPITQYYYTSPYYTYSYTNGSWYPSYTYSYGNYDNTNYYDYTNYNNGYVYTPRTGCYYTASGYYACQ